MLKSKILFICALSFVIFMSGCAAVKETAKGVAGISTKVLEDKRKDAIKKAFNYAYADCDKQVRETLRAAGCYIYADEPKKELIAAYVSETDTTPVGVFLKKIDAENTQVEVSSPSIYGKEFVFGKISAVLEKKVSLTEMEVETNVRKQQEAQ